MLNKPVTKTSFALLAAVATLALPAAAQAKIIEIGQLPDVPLPAPSCPANPCLAMTRTTGYQAKVATHRGLMAVPQDGRIVAFTLVLGKTGDKQNQFFQQRFGGEPSAAITVLRPRKHLFSKVVAESPVVKLTSFLGETVQFPLEQTLAARKGDVIALTVPTWAPVLAVGLPKDTSWRSSRSKNCNDVATQSLQTAQTTIGQTTQYRCLYATARLTYTATLITTPTPATPPKKTTPKK